MGSASSAVSNGLNDSNDKSDDSWDNQLEGALKGVGTVTSTGGLQILLQQSHLRNNFRNFISMKWSPSETNNDFKSYSQNNPRKISLNCIDFWAGMCCAVLRCVLCVYVCA
jgi:hypothetical protein